MDVAESTEATEVATDVKEESSPSAELEQVNLKEESSEEENTPVEEENTPVKEETVETQDEMIHISPKTLSKRLAKERERAERKILESLPKESEKPSIEDFDYDVEAFTKANDAYIETKAAEQADRIASEKIFVSRLDSFKEKHSDFDDVMAALPELNGNIKDAIVQSEYAGEILYKLAKDQNLADKIADMNPTKAVMELGRIESQFEPVKQKRTTTAPAPIAPVGSNGNVEKKITDMSMEEYSAWRKGGGGK